MKTILIIIFLTSGICFGQKKGDNTVVVKCSYPLQEIKARLFNNGYMIEGTDTTILSTNAKQFTWGTYAIKYLILRTDTAMILKPMVKYTKKVKDISGFTTTDDEYANLTFDKYEFSNKDLWKEVMKVASSFSDKFYTKKQ